MSDVARKYRIGIVAGELSGDKLGAGLIQAVLARNPDIQFEGIAGPNMQTAGCQALFQSDELAVMGLTEVLKDLPRLLKIKKHLLEHWAQNPPDLFIGIDAPDFNLRVAPVLKQQGVQTIQYVCPSVWAWREGRVKKIEKAVDKLFCLLPFEPKYFSDTSVDAHYVGHPMADSIPLAEIEAKTTQDYLIAVLPGSRGSEIKRLLPPFVETIRRLQFLYPEASFAIPAANDKLKERIESYLLEQGQGLKVDVLDGRADSLLKGADVALIASGTVTLETMLYGTPMVVAYKLAPSTYRIIKWAKAFKAKYFSLPNIIADKPLVQEVLQDGVTPERLTRNIQYWLDNPKARQSLLDEFKQMHLQLRQNTNEKVADLVLLALEEGESV